MTIKGILLFPGQASEERVFLLIRKHWFNYVIFLLVALLGIIPVIAAIYFWLTYPSIAADNSLDIYLIVILTIFLLCIFSALLYGFVDYYLDVYIVTDRRVVDIAQNGFFKREISELHLHQVQDVNARVDGFFETLLHFGDVYVQTAGERENFVFKSVPHPYAIARQIIDLNESHLEEEEDEQKRFDRPSHKKSGDQQPVLPLDKLESAAKSLLVKSSFSERVKNAGMVVRPEIKKKMEKNKKEYEGVLVEGKEIDL